jgi:hypothetical protein
MRAAGLLFLAAYLTTAGASRAETKFPYTRTVPPDGVTLRSGPSLEFYPTDRLAPGARLEVYREEKDGWLAVRPPPGSFSLVERRQLKAGAESGVAVAVTDDVLACVGSRTEAVRTYVSQVRLRKDEPVELLDKWDDETPESEDQAWCRIAPPSGEFRWVQADEFKRKAAIPVTVPARPESPTPDSKPDSPSPAVAPRSSFEADGWVRAAGDREPVAAKPAAERASDLATNRGQATPETPMPLIATPGTAASVASAPVVSVPVASAPTASAPIASVPVASVPVASVPAASVPVASAPIASVPVASAPAVSVPAIAIPVEPVPAAAPVSSADQWSSRTPPPRQRVDELEVDLALMVAGDAQTWQLAELRRRVEANLIRYQTNEERVQARRLLERIAEFEQLHSRMTQPPTTPQTAQATPPAASSPPPAVSAAAETAASDAAGVKYDGSGWLVPVHSTTGTAPPFALLDAQGEVLGYVSPTPGLNLQRYLRKQVGIFGLRET